MIFDVHPISAVVQVQCSLLFPLRGAAAKDPPIGVTRDDMRWASVKYDLFRRRSVLYCVD